MTPSQIISRLDSLPPAQVPGLDLIIEFNGQDFSAIPPDQLLAVLDRQDEIRQAGEDLQEYIDKTKEVITRCLSILPQPSQTVPAGF